ncbi:hypothetical protein FJQ54_16700 [Sandaracinobacter neustonicus]|uniref:O-methyltransferase domain-containing protein n=1 Tax=Sandaracinobacter neustonicus TaxID=1715348 RepID=A0A501XDW7_9SPHN|nr:methyltransferase [Sandaracinobacter neustonicus]TPE58686.1 hypothetical protein FJQ54_16700 [Sandaracinobacter neustonicus]
MQPDLPPEARVLGLAGDYFISRALHVAAELGLADAIADQPLSATAIAATVGADAGAVERILRALETRGIFTRTPEGWAHSPASDRLRRAHPQTLADFVGMLGSEANWLSAGAMADGARHGHCPAEQLFEGGLWGHFRRNPAESAQFDAAMLAKSHAEIAGVTPVLDLEGVSLLADVGGGRGHFLCALLDRHPALQGLLLDQPQVVAGALPHPRMQTAGLDFFADDLPVADAYLLANVIHDWDKPRALAILRAVRAAAPAHARLLLVEMVLPPVPVPHPGFSLDMVMLATTGGEERDAAGYAALLAEAGWAMQGVTPTQSPVSIVTAGLMAAK